MNHAKKMCLFIFFLSLSIIIHAQKQCVIEGDLGSISKYVSKVFLQYADIVSFIRHTDSAEVKNGKYSFTVPFEEPGAVFLLLRLNKTAFANDGLLLPEEENRVLDLFIDEGKIMIASDRFPFASSKVVGSIAEEQARELNKSYNPLHLRLQEFLFEVKKGLEKNDDRAETLMRGQIEYTYEDLFSLYKKTINAPGSRIGAYTLSLAKQTIKYAPAMLVNRFYDQLNTGIKQTSYGIEFKKLVDFTEGIDAPGFTRVSNLGDTIQLAKFKGKYVLIDFWGSWCKPCREENPFMVNLYNKYKSSLLEFIGIAKDGDDEAGKKLWLDAIQKDSLPWINVLYKGNDIMPLDAVYHVSSYPSNFLVDPKGKIIAKNIRGVALEKKFAELFGIR